MYILRAQQTLIARRWGAQPNERRYLYTLSKNREKMAVTDNVSKARRYETIPHKRLRAMQENVHPRNWECVTEEEALVDAVTATID